jgi:hypothetical protein
MSRRLVGGLLPVLVLLCGFALPAEAQEKMKAGMWTGAVLTPDGEAFDMSYDVSYMEDKLVIELILPADVGMGNVMATNPMQEAGFVIFTLDVGEVVNCELMAQDDGQYEGECIDSTGGAALMTMVPPTES